MDSSNNRVCVLDRVPLELRFLLVYVCGLGFAIGFVCVIVGSCPIGTLYRNKRPRSVPNYIQICSNGAGAIMKQRSIYRSKF